jgi:hypothetical protein
MANNTPFSERVTSITNQKIMPMVVDTVLKSNVLAGRVLGSVKKWNGERMQFPFKFQKNTNGKSFSGLDTFDLSMVDNKRKLSFSPSFFEQPTIIDVTEVSLNGTDEKILDLIETQIKSDAQDAADTIGDMFYGDGSGNINKDFLGLSAIVDDGSLVATYGGQSRATYPSLRATVTASGGTLTLQKMSTLYNAATHGTLHPDLGVTSQAVFSFYESLLTPQERVNKDVGMIRNKNSGLNSGNGLIGGTGYTGLYYKGFPILADEKCPEGTLFFLNENFLNFYALKMDRSMPISVGGESKIVGNDYDPSVGFGFTCGDWIIPTNQAARIKHIYLSGQLISENPRAHAKLTGITGV